MRRLLLAVLVGAATPGVAQVPAARLTAAARDSAHWLTYSGSYASHRHSSLRELTPATVGTLRPVWMYQSAAAGWALEGTPLVADGVLYTTESQSVVTALDLRTGRPIWRWQPSLAPNLRLVGFPPANRGVALLDSTVYVGTLDATLAALDARTGALRWRVPVADNALGYSITGAPLAVDGLVLVGVSGGEAGIRGFLDAYDARTGERRWRFHTVPGPGEAGHETWGGTEAWRTGGGSTWLTGSYDPALGLVYWGVGNPGPDLNGDVRPGDNLYTSSLVALDVRTGRLRWHFQFTPHDEYDWDANQIPVLADLEIDGRLRRCVVTANRNGFYYVLDRETGAFLRGTAYATQTWADGLDAAGRPRRRPGMTPSDSGTLIFPSMQGATNWASPAFDAARGQFVVAAREMGARYFRRAATYVPGRDFMGGGEEPLEDDTAWGAIRALDVRTGALRWQFRLPTPPWAGVLSTAGGLVFGGSSEGWVFALDAADGTPRWRFQTGGLVTASPISFLLDGRQHIAVHARNALVVLARP